MTVCTVMSSHAGKEMQNARRVLDVGDNENLNRYYRVGRMNPRYFPRCP